MITRGKWRDHFLKTAVEYIDLEVKNSGKNDATKALFVEKSSDSEYVETRLREGMGPLVASNDASEISDLTLGDGYPKRIYQHKYAGKISYPMEVKLFEKTGLIAAHTKALARAPEYLMRTLRAAMFEYGDTVAASVTTVNGRPIVDTIGADGLPVFYAAHTYKSNGAATWANLSTTALTLNRTNWSTHSNAIYKWRGANGEYLDAMPEKLIIPVDLRQAAFEMCASTYQPESALNALNSAQMDLKSGDYTVVKELTSTADWYIQTSFENRFIIRWAMKPKTETWYEESNQVDFVSLTMVCSMGCDDPRRYFAVKAA